MFKSQVIVAEDNRILQDVMRFNLIRAGFEVRAVTDGAAALLQLEQQPADLLITDCQMPGMSGIELCRRIRAHAIFCDLPILFCTAKGLEIGQETLDDLRLPVVLCKPFSPSAMIEKARMLLANSAVPV